MGGEREERVRTSPRVSWAQAAQRGAPSADPRQEFLLNHLHFSSKVEFKWRILMDQVPIQFGPQPSVIWVFPKINLAGGGVGGVGN